MTENQYLTLLRGINVGGSNIIKMTDLKSCFEKMGFTDVLTYIQSGNVLFRSDEKDKTKLTNKIEMALSENFKYTSRVVVISNKQLKKVVDEAPAGFGKDPGKYKYDVIFLKEPLTPEELIKNVSTRPGVDKAYTGENVLYFSRLISRASQSHLTRIISIPGYQYITVRNWNTTSRLLTLMEQ
jgi:uncharacterized protein (DUF1697 family)